MAFDIRITGPELLLEENRIAFLRIEESVRQYSAHSRDSIYLIRRPLSLSEDHFALLWSHGAALVGMYPYGGDIRGSIQGDWRSIMAELPATPVPAPSSTGLRPARMFAPPSNKKSSEQQPSQAFENPYLSLLQGRREFSELLKQSGHPVSADQAATGIVDRVPDSVPDALSAELTLIALFTGTVHTLHVEEAMGRGQPASDEPAFRAITIEDATARTIVHLPNLLRVSDHGTIAYSSAQLDVLSNTLNRSAQFQMMFTRAENGHANTPLGDSRATKLLPPHKYPSQQRAGRNWRIALLIAGTVLAFYVIRSLLVPATRQAIDSTTVARAVSHAPSEIVIELPSDIQLFVSPNQYRTRSELDRALARGEGQRYLPDREQIVVMDSVTFAKGIYGYFNVDNSWRKGKLLQTLEHADTVTIVKFLDPLPS